MKRLWFVAAVWLAAATVAGLWAASAEEVKERMAKRVAELAPLKTGRTVGETAAGYVALANPGSADAKARKLVEEENADRRIVYEAIAAKQGTAADQVGAQRAKAIREKAAPGVLFQAADGTWAEKK